MGDTAPRSLCLGGELLIPLRGAAVLSSTVDQQQPPLGANTLYLNSLHNGPAYDLRLHYRTVTELRRSALHWSATMDQSQPASDTHLKHVFFTTFLQVVRLWPGEYPAIRPSEGNFLTGVNANHLTEFSTVFLRDSQSVGLTRSPETCRIVAER